MVHIQEPKLLKEDVKQLHQAHVGTAGGAHDEDDDSANESTRRVVFPYMSALGPLRCHLVSVSTRISPFSAQHEGDT